MVDPFLMLKLLINAAIHRHPFFNVDNRASIPVIIAQMREETWIVIGLQQYFPEFRFVGTVRQLENQIIPLVAFDGYQLHPGSSEVVFSVCEQADFIVKANPTSSIYLNQTWYGVESKKLKYAFDTLAFSADFEGVNTMILSLTSLLSHPALPFLSHAQHMHFFPVISGCEQATPCLSAGIHIDGENKELLCALLHRVMSAYLGLSYSENSLSEQMEFNVREIDGHMLIKMPAHPGHALLRKMPRVVMGILSNAAVIQTMKEDLDDVMNASDNDETSSMENTPRA